MTDQERIAELTAQRDELRKCLLEIVAGFESGIFVRDITHDGETDWAIKLLPFLQTLVRAQVAIVRST